MIETIVIAFGVILVSMMLHELAHGLVAYWLGDDTAKLEGRLTLNPLKHLDPVLSLLMPLLLFLSGGPIFGGAKPVPINTRNLKHGEWGMALGYFSGWLMDGGIIGTICGDFVMINLGFGIFNLIPIPPLDGSRVIYAMMPEPIQNLMEVMERWGIIIVMVVVVVFPGVISTIMTGAMAGILDAFYWIVGVR